MAATQIKEMRAPHDAVLDLLLANPFATLAEMKRVTGYSISWLSQMIRSDCFRAAYEARRGDIEAALMTETVAERLTNLAHVSLDMMEELLIEKAPSMDVDEKIDAFDKVMKANGYAPNSRTPPPPSNQTNVFLMDRSEMAQLQARITSGVETPVIEGTAVQVPDGTKV